MTLCQSASSAGADRELFEQRHEVSVEAGVETQEGDFQSLEGIWKSEFEAEPAPRLDWKGSLRLRGDAFDRLEPGKPGQSSTWGPTRRVLMGDHGDLELREFYMRYQGTRASVILGKQQIIWGNADGLRLLDVVNPHDFRKFILDDFVDSRIPLWSVNAELPLDWTQEGEMLPSSTALQLLWIPDRTYHRFPEDGATYAFTSPLFVPRPPPGISFERRPAERPDRFFADSNSGLRLSTFWKGWDLSLNYLYHYDHTPGFYREISMQDGRPHAIVTPRYVRSHVIGGTAGTAFGDWTFRGEVGGFLSRPFSTDAPEVRRGVVLADEISLMLGLDWYGLEDTLVSWQLFQGWLVQDTGFLARDRGEFHLTQVIRREFSDARWTLELMWLQGLNRGDGLLRPKAAWEWNGNTQLWLGVDLFYGSAEGLFGQFNDHDRVVAGMAVKF